MSLKKLIQWSKIEFSHLPWRQNRTLYTTLVSEIMLQQTTVSTVQKHFDRFINRFPTLANLAFASEEELLVAWKGLGYYRRARNLKKIAESLIHHHGGEFPNVESELRKIPGIGPYTSGALIGIGMDERALAVDANLERVISRLYGIEDQKGLKLQKKINLLFSENKILNEKKISFRELNEALMDLGRVYCQARKVSCDLCPLRIDCQAFQQGRPLEFPRQGQEELNKKEDHTLKLLRIIVIKKNKILTYQKNESEWLSGQYEVPTLMLWSSDKKLKQYLKIEFQIDLSELKMFRTGITKYKIENYLLALSFEEFKEMNFQRPVLWRDLSSEEANLSTASLKALKLLDKG